MKGEGRKTRSPHAWIWSIVPEERTIPITHITSCIPVPVRLPTPLIDIPHHVSTMHESKKIPRLAPQLLTIPIMQGICTFLDIFFFLRPFSVI